MHLHVVRHAKAEPDSPDGDAGRPLRPRGRRQAEALGTFFAGEDPAPTVVLSSPYRRARETAERVWAALGLEPQVDDRLGADRTLADYLDVVADLAGARCAVIIGHNPLCAGFVSLLAEGPTGVPRRHETARAVALELDPADPIGRAEIVGSFRPPE